MAGNDYGQQLRSALDTARSNVLTLLQKSSTQREQSATTLGHAEQTMYVNDDKFQEAQQAALQSEEIYKLSVAGSTLTGIATDTATKASSAATEATTAMSIAATSIKALADAYDTLSSQAAGINAIAQNDDSNTAMSEAARDAQILANNTANLVERLKVTSLGANIESARSTAGAALVGIQAMSNEMQSLVDRVSALLATARQKLDAKRKLDSSSEQAEKKALELYQSSRVDDEALTTSVHDINVVVNGDLTVSQGFAQVEDKAKDSDTKVRRTVPTLKATFHVTSISDTLNNTGKTTGGSTKGKAPSGSTDSIEYQFGTKGCRFFAVPVQDAPTFTFDAAMKLIRDREARSASTPPNPQPPTVEQQLTQLIYTHVNISVPDATASQAGTDTDYTATLATDTNTNPLVMGQSYCVFVLREPKAGFNSANAADLSLPSPPIQLVYPIGQVEISFPPPMFPARVTRIHYPKLTVDAGDELKPKALLAPTSHLARSERPVLFTAQLTPPTLPHQPHGLTILVDLTELISEARAIIMRKEVYAAVKADSLFLARLLNPSYYTRFEPPSKKSEPQQGQEKDQKQAQKPNPDQPPQPSVALFRLGDTDAYGDIIDPDQDYVCLALLVGGNRKTPAGFNPKGSPAYDPNNTTFVSTGSNTPSVLLEPVTVTFKKAGTQSSGNNGGQGSGASQTSTPPSTSGGSVAATSSDKRSSLSEAKTVIATPANARTSGPSDEKTLVPQPSAIVPQPSASEEKTIIPQPPVSDEKTLVPSSADTKAEGSPSSADTKAEGSPSADNNNKPNGNKNPNKSK